MANVTVSNITTRSALIIISGLQYNANQYSNIKFRFSCHGRLATDYDYKSPSASTTIYLDFSNENYLGYNWFTPNTEYTIVVVCTYNGVDYVLDPAYFTTNNISSPTGSITPSLYTKIKRQVYESCVPMCLSTAMDRFRAIKVGSDYENFSVSYIFGNGGYSWGMYFKEAIENCMRDGSPRWDLVSTSFTSDEKSITNSQNTYNNADSYAKSNALLQRFSGHVNVDPYDTSSVKSAIQNYGCFMLNIRIPNNFYSVGSDGIVPQPDSYTGFNHSLLLIGLTTKNGKPHWIAQNSWGTNWGANGYCYIPYDWGIGADPPIRSNMATLSSWTLESYYVYNNSVSTYVPPTPINVTAVKNGPLTALVSWNNVLPGGTYVIFASRKSNDEWYIKSRTSSNSLTISFDGYAEYKIRVVSVSSNLYSDYSDFSYVTLANIAPWEWMKPKTVGQGFNITRAEWIAFCNKINEVRIAVLGQGSEYSFTTSTTYIDKDKPFYAWIFLQAANAINEINGQVSQQCLSVKAGDNIYAWYFENLKSALNNAIL